MFILRKDTDMNENVSFNPLQILNMISDVATEKVTELKNCSDFIPTCLHTNCASLDDDLDCQIDFKNEKTGETLILKLIDDFSMSIDNDDKLFYLSNLSKKDLQLIPVPNEEYTFKIVDQNFE